MKRELFAIFLSLLIGNLCALGQTYQSAFENSRALLKQNRYREALQEAQRAIVLDGSQWGAYYVAGTALVGLEQQGEAINLFQAALAHAPEQAKPTINQAIAACRQILGSKSQASAPPAYPAPQYAPAQQPMAAPPQPDQGQPQTNSTVISGCGEAFFGFGDDRPGTLTLVGPNIEWRETEGPSHDFAVQVDQVSKFSPIFFEKNQKKELQEGRIDISRYGGDSSIRVGLHFNGKSKYLDCPRDAFVEIFQYFQAHGFYQGVRLIE